MNADKGESHAAMIGRLVAQNHKLKIEINMLRSLLLRHHNELLTRDYDAYRETVFFEDTLRAISH